MIPINVMNPWLGEEEAAAAAEAVASGWVAQGPGWPSSRRRSPRPAGRHAVALSNCTTALHLALVVAGIGPGDEVVVPSFSFIATANAVGTSGRGRCSPTSTPRPATSPRGRSQLPDAGYPRGDRRRPGRRPGRSRADAGAVRPAGIVVVEDAACAVGSTYRGRPVGAGADLAAWSFHPRKILTTGEGGMLTTRTRLADRAAAARARHERLGGRPARAQPGPAGGVPRRSGTTSA